MTRTLFYMRTAKHPGWLPVSENTASVFLCAIEAHELGDAEVKVEEGLCIAMVDPETPDVQEGLQVVS